MKRRDRANIGVFLNSEAAEWMTVSKWQRQRTSSRTELQRSTPGGVIILIRPFRAVLYAVTISLASNV